MLLQAFFRLVLVEGLQDRVVHVELRAGAGILRGRDLSGRGGDGVVVYFQRRRSAADDEVVGGAVGFVLVGEGGGGAVGPAARLLRATVGVVGQEGLGEGLVGQEALQSLVQAGRTLTPRLGH